jgi:hypothetical protein
MIYSFVIQDTIRQKTIAQQDTIRQFSDFSAPSLPARDFHFQPVIKLNNPDTTSVCFRNSIANDSANYFTRTDENHSQNFPFVFTAINRKIQEEIKADLVKHLKTGNELPVNFFHNDWILPVLLLTVFLYGVIYAESVKFFKGIIKFATLGGINESASRDMGGLFQWQSTLFNLASFINISLFAFLTVLWYDFSPFEAKRTVYWLISLGIIISALTLRHLMCIVIGNLSGETETFREYLIGIYQAYRLAGVLLLVIAILILYTTFIPVNILFYAGFSVVALLYFIRIFRLFLIFINRHASIFYLILYLCALEILPVVIIIKYVTGLV